MIIALNKNNTVLQVWRTRQLLPVW